MSTGIAEEGVLRKLLQQMNAHLPSKRIRLSELLMSKEPSYADREGRKYVLREDELTKIQSIVRERGLGDIKLPIVIFAESSHERSVWRIEGRDECGVIAAVLARPPDPEVQRLFLYAPHLALLRKELPTTTVCMVGP